VGVSPLNVFALPKAKSAIKRGRPTRRPEIMTCSPFKNSLLKISMKKREKDLYDWPIFEQPSYSGKKTDKEKNFCRGVMNDIKGQVQKTGRSALNA
jgi:hypothetical protein